MIARHLEPIVVSNLFKGKAIIIIGPRQVGKTTLVKHIYDGVDKKKLFLNCDDLETKNVLSNQSINRLTDLVGGYDLVVIDEAQRVRDIGIILKIIIDNISTTQLIVTGSSALELSNQINEPLTGRKFEYILYPISTGEMVNETSKFEESGILYKRLIYGSYPDVVKSPGNEKEILNNLVSSYLYRDLFAYQDIRKPVLLENLLKALALQIGSEVSYNELSRLLSSDIKTIERYIDLFEKVYIIFRLNSFSRNLRTELKKSRKIYFYDNGIRNVLIRNFNDINSRTDTGQLWENFLVGERIKHTHYKREYLSRYFWRTNQQQEIDYIEDFGGKLYAYEFKWSPRKKSLFSKSFINNYNVAETRTITPNNYLEFIT